MISIGPSNVYTTYSARSHNWATGMNQNLVKAATMLQASVKSRVTALPASPSANDCYIIPASGSIATWVSGSSGLASDWYVIEPVVGTLVYVQDENVYVSYAGLGVWTTIFDVNSPAHPAQPRALAFYSPGSVRPSTKVFYYIAAIEFTIPIGAPGSVASLGEPASAELVFTVAGGTGSTGTITFPAGQTQGVFDFPTGKTFLGTPVESDFTPANVLTVSSPSDTFDAVGLSVSFKGSEVEIY